MKWSNEQGPNNDLQSKHNPYTQCNGQTNSSAESSAVIRERVLKANNIQFKRQAKFNDKLTPDDRGSLRQ
jgi:predicted ATPase with chaperone activity